MYPSGSDEFLLHSGLYRERGCIVGPLFQFRFNLQQLAGWDVGALFQVLQNHGDATTAEALAQLRSKWNYYATMALAGLPGGEGVPSLIRQVQDATAGAEGFGDQSAARRVRRIVGLGITASALCRGDATTR